MELYQRKPIHKTETETKDLPKDKVFEKDEDPQFNQIVSLRRNGDTLSTKETMI